MTVVREHLLAGGTLDDLAARYAIRAIRHRDYANLVRLNYSQIASPFAEPIVRECRGIVLDEADGWAPVARGFDKFFNLGEPLAPPIDWTTARVQEKVDGTLCMTYFYGGVPAVREVALASVEDVLVSFQAMNPRAQEGYVVVDGGFRRVKVKHPGYVRLHHLKFLLTTKRLVDAVRIGEGAEIAAALPELGDRVRDVETRLARLCDEIECDFDRLRGVEDPKAFAFEALRSRFSAALFGLRRQTIGHPREFFARMRLETLVDLLGFGDPDEPIEDVE